MWDLPPHNSGFLATSILVWSQPNLTSNGWRGRTFLHFSRRTKIVWIVFFSNVQTRRSLRMCRTDDVLMCTEHASLSSCAQSSAKLLSDWEDNISSLWKGAPGRIYLPSLPISTVLASAATFTNRTAASLVDTQEQIRSECMKERERKKRNLLLGSRATVSNWIEILDNPGRSSTVITDNLARQQDYSDFNPEISLIHLANIQ